MRMAEPEQKDDASSASSAKSSASSGSAARKRLSAGASAAASAAAAPGSPTPFDRAKRHLLAACSAIGGGLAVAGTLDRTTGGVLVLVGWLAAIVALHRLGRTGSDRGPDPKAPDAERST